MTFSKYLNFTMIETDNIFFTWQANISQMKQLEIQQLLSKIGTSNIGDFYKVNKSNFSELYNFNVIAQKFNDDGTIFIMLGE